IPAALPDPRVRARAGPVLPAVGGCVEAALFRIDDRVDAPGIARSERDSDSAELLRGEASALDRTPRLAAVVGTVEAAARAVGRGIDVPRGTARLPHRRQDRLRVLRIDGEVDRARVLVLEEDALPGLSAVARTKHAALGVGSVGVPEGRDEDEVRVLGIDQDTSDLLAVPHPAR